MGLKHIISIFTISLILTITSCRTADIGVLWASNEVQGDYVCESSSQTLNCLKLSSGLGTRCYQDNSDWRQQPYCAEGWKLTNDEGCHEWRLCGSYRDYPMDRDCFNTDSYEEIERLCDPKLFVEQGVCIHNEKYYKLDCIE